MSYLTNLLDRAAHGSDIRPRATLPFQPASELAGLAERDVIVEGAPTPLPIVTSTTPRIEPARPRVPAPTATPPPTTTQPSIVERNIDRSITVRTSDRTPIVREREPSIVHEHESLIVPSSPPMTPPMTPNAPPQATEAIPAMRPIGTSVIVRPVIVRPTIEHDTTQVIERIEHANGHHAPIEAPPSIRPIAIAPVAREQSSPALPQIAMPRPAAEPTVRITIGRVDVRAVVQQTQSAKPAPAARPRMTLEDYLRTRNGGAR